MAEDELKKKKLAEKQKEAEEKKAEEQIKTMLRTVLDEKGFDRMMNVKLSNSELFMATAQNLLGAFQKLRRKITDEEVLFVLKSIKQRTQRESTITFERK
ncbi:MAG: DNA-binding protein [Candidatus Micrarchaeia archaeon]|jgi:DNA-binding TFAR19-related protein (PDSD5 family)